MTAQSRLVVHLLGAPRVERDGVPQPPPRGHKAWALLAHLVLARAPVPRRRLCSLLFADAEDPLAALRWNLSALRALLGDPGLLRGDPLELPLPGAVVDVRAVTSGTWSQADGLGVGHELLEGLAFPSCPSFEVWLQAERRHLQGATAALLREATVGALARGDAAGAVHAADRLVRADPYDEGAHALLVRALAAAGDGVGAARQVAACRELFRRELGCEPGPALDDAATTVTAAPVAGARAGRAAVVALVDAGRAALGAGAVDAGLQCLRRAVADALTVGDPGVHAGALTALGSALVHAVRGRDDEGATALHRAIDLATSTADGGAQPVVADAALELAHVEFLRARYDRVEVWLGRAEAVGGDDDLRARVLSSRGSAATDVGRYRTALTALRGAVRLTSDDRTRSYALSMLGRAHLLREELAEAAEALQQAQELAERAGWTAFVPWPESLLAHVDLCRGALDRAESRLEHAFALGCHVGDPCWEGVSARGLWLLQVARGQAEEGLATLLDARARCTRLPDGYLWLDVWTLDAVCGLAVRTADPRAGAWARELRATAERHGMRELAVRALVHGAGLGEVDPEVAVTLAETVDNPALAGVVRVGRPATPVP